MNSGELTDRISLLELKRYENTYTWEPLAALWAKSERLTGNNLFSKVGLGAKSIKFTIRKWNDLTLHNAFKWNGKHCFLTDIHEIDRMYYEVTAALVEPKVCSIKRTGEPKRNELNRPIYDEPVLITFPGCLIEKYLGQTQNKSMAYTETRYVLVTPKIIDLDEGEIVIIEETPYTVIIPHILDDFKNEYEIMVKEDN
jgi:head-tail adaptor